MNQYEMIYNYNKKTREPFKTEVFHRSDDDIVEQLLNVIRACQRTKQFAFRLIGHRVIENPMEINQILFDLEEKALLYKRKKYKNAENIYDFIQVRDTDMKILEVEYAIYGSDGSDFMKVHIAIPKIIDGCYFRIKGTNYVPLYQIVENISYNNTMSNKPKCQKITMKLMFNPISLFRNTGQLTTINKEKIDCVYYDCSFNKSTFAFNFILAKLGLYDTMRFLGLYYINITEGDFNYEGIEDLYIFQKNDIYISVPKKLYDNDPTTQSFIYTIISTINKKTSYSDLFNIRYWLKVLGGSFGNATEEKGEVVCESFEGVYDLATKDNLSLPEEHKSNIYTILRWAIREFSNLRVKDNLDLTHKRIRCAEYIASFYAMNLSKKIHRLSFNTGKSATLHEIRSHLRTDVMAVINSISNSKSSLRMYKDNVSDLDAYNGVKFTFKGVSTMGGDGKKTATLPDTTKRIYPEYLGRLDLDTSGASDPGMSGVLCPYVNLHDGKFADNPEPLTWEEEYQETLNDYHSMVSRKEVMTFRNEVLKEDNLDIIDGINETINTYKTLLIPMWEISRDEELVTPMSYIKKGVN